MRARRGRGTRGGDPARPHPPSPPQSPQNTVDKLIKKTNLAMVIGTHSWREQFLEAITVSAGGTPPPAVPRVPPGLATLPWGHPAPGTNGHGDAQPW